MALSPRRSVDSAARRPLPLVQIIARLNVGGATIQAISLTGMLRPKYRTNLVSGIEGPREGDMRHLANALGVRPVVIPSLNRELGRKDLRALYDIVRILRRERPMILHTHTAKAGTLGRVAAVLAGRHRPPVVVHQFHGHVLEGYFSPLRSTLFKWIERVLARFTTRLIVVSEEVRQDLIRMKIASADRIVVMPLGLDLDRFLVPDEERGELRSSLRAALGIPPDRKVVTFVGRVVPIKRLDRFLRIARRLKQPPEVHFLIVGDGELRPRLESSAMARALGDRVTWTGFRHDLPAIYFASDVVALTSDNEGTPTSLIEAQAAGIPVVATDVGGSRDVVEDRVTGRLLNREDEPGMADAIAEILRDSELSQRLIAAGRTSSLSRYALERLVRDIDDLYTRLLAETKAGVPSRAAGGG